MSPVTRPASLLLILVLAKLAMIWGHAAPLTGWSAAAYIWQDVMVALAFAAFDWGLQKIGATSRIAWAAYCAIAFYTAINIPVARVVSTPLTRPMLRAARGPLADSMVLYVTAANVALVLSLLALAASFPWLLARAPRRLSRLAVVCILPPVLLGPMASRRVDTRGIDRNAITTLIGNRAPQRASQPVRATGAPRTFRQHVRPRTSRSWPAPPANST